ncbi:hypothetical protein ACQCP7_25770 [Ralstonia pseudosolanacearum]|uniref:hypothetical protein n=1 Tax=Ralstonia pseudosolanacearum TaxID=1310165 RepID=UPI003CEE80DA
MTKGHYYFNRSLRGYDFEDAGTNRREAIRQGRELAVALRHSVQIWQARPVEGLPDRLGHYYVGSLEYPYYLSTACTITASDITVNI